MNLRQAIWAAAVIVALLLGFLGGRMLSGERQELVELQERVAALEARLGGGGSAQPQWRIAVVKVNDLALRYQEENPELQEQLKQTLSRLQEELQRLKQRQERGEISEQEANVKALELQQAVQKEILLAVAGPIQWAVTQVAQEEGYHMVMKHKDVVIYYQDDVIDDITEQVWERMQSLR